MDFVDPYPMVCVLAPLTMMIQHTVQDNDNNFSFRKIYERLRAFVRYLKFGSCKSFSIVVLLCLHIINNYVGQSNDMPPFVNVDDGCRIYNSSDNCDVRIPGEPYDDFRYGDGAFFVMGAAAS